ncbi:hypothetical protein NEOLI_001159 [Neolecta irregularis DAH-3]|uniref:Uncharacterized protein n=1 Tax=Neolecta irregularis (strain DAH-3) TaxID=1198029 RepID=A0A1U7LS60_NEOID|nr:hypothetical protein NEOLI_001159 [Neolecta irregularis DAH-3]|eukprot:OLL25458.1 hypothetical protein NEOLI_001159 [Neolecta irregularis DAH-3]
MSSPNLLNTYAVGSFGATEIEGLILLELQKILKTCEAINENLKKAITNSKQEVPNSQSNAIQSMEIWRMLMEKPDNAI